MFPQKFAIRLRRTLLMRGWSTAVVPSRPFLYWEAFRQSLRGTSTAIRRQGLEDGRRRARDGNGRVRAVDEAARVRYAHPNARGRRWRDRNRWTRRRQQRRGVRSEARVPLVTQRSGAGRGDRNRGALAARD